MTFEVKSTSMNMVGWRGLEPPTSRLSADVLYICYANVFSAPLKTNQPELSARIRLSSSFKYRGSRLVEIKGIEPLTPCLQSRCSPSWAKPPNSFFKGASCGTLKIEQHPWINFFWELVISSRVFLRKEVIQPHLPIRLPCYDLTPIIDPTFDDVLLAVRLSASGVANSHGLTGGVYKARERIHRGMLIRDY